MARGVRLLAAGTVVGGAVAVTIAFARAAGPRASGLQFVFGAMLLFFGALTTAIRLIIARRTPGPPTRPGPDLNRLCRGGWVGIVLGLAALGLDYVDGRVEEETARAKSRAALDRGQAAAKAGDWTGAADAFSEAVQFDPSSADALRRRAVAYLRLGENERAIADLDAALGLEAGDAKATYNRGLARSRLGDMDGALADFSQAIRLDPNYARAYHARGNMNARAGNAAQAEADWQRAMELDPALNKGTGLDL
jgi:tetratricopeptide (TPR) repeat protein